MQILKSKITQSKLFLSMVYLVYFLCFQIVYQKWVVEIFGYQGYSDNFNLNSFFVAGIMLMVLILMTRNSSAPSDIFVNLAICSIFVPSAVIYAGQNINVEFILITFTAFVVLIFSTYFFKLKTIKFPHLSDNWILYFLTAFASANLIGLVFFSGLKFINFDLSKVYDYRREAAESVPGIFGYINSTATKVAIPFAIVLAAILRRWVFLLGILCLSVLFFALTQHKGPLFTPFLVLFFLYISDRPSLKRYLVIGWLVVVAASGLDLFLYSEFGGRDFFGWVSSLSINRVLLVPSLLNSMYIDYFSSADKYYWATSKLSMGLVDSPSDLNSANLIGYLYFGNSEMSANTGWIGSGYANAGYFGVILYSLLIGAWFSLLDAYAKKIGKRIVICLFIIPVFTLITSTDITDMLITHGLILSLIVLFTLKPERQFPAG